MTSQPKPRPDRGGGGNIKQFTVFCCIGPDELGKDDETPIGNFEGSDPRNYKVARNETYIDEDGVQKEAVSFSLEDGLTVWYDLAEIKQAIPLWIPPTTAVYENIRHWYKGLRMKK